MLAAEPAAQRRELNLSLVVGRLAKYHSRFLSLVKAHRILHGDAVDPTRRVPPQIECRQRSRSYGVAGLCCVARIEHVRYDLGGTIDQFVVAVLISSSSTGRHVGQARSAASSGCEDAATSGRKLAS
jgi:hypothetical protein